MILENIVSKKKRDIEEPTIKKNRNLQIHRRFSLFSNKGPSQEQKPKKSTNPALVLRVLPRSEERTKISVGGT